MSKIIDSMSPEIRQEFYNLQRELDSEREKAKSYSKGISYLILALIAVVIFFGYQFHHQDYWSMDWQEPYIVHHNSTLFSENKFLYKWGKDTRKQEGWLPLDSNGKYTGLDILVPADDTTEPPQPTP